MSRKITPGLTTLEGRISRIAGLIDEMKGEEIVVLDLRGLCDFADAIVIATVRSRTQMQAITHRLVEALRNEGLRPLNSADPGAERWSLLDYADVIVHLLTDEARSFYALEQLWGDGVEMVWQQSALA